MIDAALGVLGGVQPKSKDKPALTGVRALATGAVLYTAGRAAFKSRRFLREQFSRSQAADDETTPARGQDEPEPDEHSPEEEAEAAGRQDDDAGEADDESSWESTTPLPNRKPVRRAARQQRPQPSLELPQQRWPRIGAARK